MTITKRPSRKIKDEILTDAIISKGGSSPLEIQTINHNIKITIRLPNKMLKIIDNYLENSISKKTRTSWIKEAVEEKIKKEIETQNAN